MFFDIIFIIWTSRKQQEIIFSFVTWLVSREEQPTEGGKILS